MLAHPDLDFGLPLLQLARLCVVFVLRNAHSFSYDLADPNTGEQRAVLDLAWPNGVQEELSQPVAVLLNEEAETLAIASQAGFRCFTSVRRFKQYVEAEVFVEELAA